MHIFSRANSKEYNEQLENILESKEVNSDAKNLLLSMFYKIENSYNDYYVVKSNVPTKEDFIKKILSIIEDECKEIVVVTPETELSKPLKEANENCIIDVTSGKILVYANEKDLLYAIFMLDIKYNQYKKDKEYDLINASKEELLQYRAIQNFFSKGTAINESEVIRDFSGWSWSTNHKDIEDININLIYQNILLLVGTKTRDKILIPKARKTKFSSMQANVQDLRKYNNLAEENEEKKDINSYNEIIKEAFIQSFDYAKVKNIIYDIRLIILALNIKDDKEKKKQIIKRLKEEKKLVTLMENKEEFLATLEYNLKKLNNNIIKIDKILSDKRLLEKEYKKRNEKLPNDKKIFSPNHLIRILENEKRQNKNEIEAEKKLFNVKTYNQQQTKYKKEIKFYDAIIQSCENIDKMLIKIQMEFLKCFTILIESASTKEELISLLYKFRYYCMIPLEDGRKIKEIPELQKEIKDVINLIIDRCIDKKVIENISNSVSLCYIILRYIFETQTTNLEAIEIKITKNNEEIISINDKKEKSMRYYITIDIFDGKEQVESHTEVVDNLKLLNIRLKKKIPLFYK